MAFGAGTAASNSWEEKIHSINSSLIDVAAVSWMAGKCGVQPCVIACLGVCWIAGFLLWGFTGEIVCMTAGLAYPMYASFKAVESEQHDELNQWLKYWTTYAALTLIESLFYRMLIWVPFYHLLRILIVLWLFLPSTRGADSIYSWVVGPVLRRYSPRIDAALARSAEDVRDTLGCAGASEVREVLRNAVASGAGYVAHDLGMEDLIVNELTKAAGARLGHATNHRRSAEPCLGGARARVASPAPRCSAAPTPKLGSCESNDESGLDGRTSVRGGA